MFLIVDFCPPKFSIYYSYLEKLPEVYINDGQQIDSFYFIYFCHSKSINLNVIINLFLLINSPIRVTNIF